jgi:glycosyltransferase involved in cell wall biosynthesis
MATKINLCFVVNNLNVGGLEKVVLSLLNHLDTDLFTLSVVCLDGTGKMFEEIIPGRVSCLVLNKSASKHAARFSVDPEILWKIRTFFQQHKVDIVHAHNLAPLIYGGLAARSMFRRPKVVYTEHNQIYKATRRGKQKFQLYILLADVVGVCSVDLKEYFRRNMLFSSEAKVLYNGIDGKRFQEVDGSHLRKEWGYDDDVFVVGTAVVLSEQKGIPYLLQAAKIVCEQAPEVRFVIAGDGPLRAELETMNRQMGLTEKVKFLGYRSDIPHFISAIQLYALSSLWEGLPLALIEACAIGKPMVATTVGGNPEIIEHGKNGYLVAPKDVDNLAKHILEVVRNPTFREEVRERNKKKFQKLFSLEAMLDTHTNLYLQTART